MYRYLKLLIALASGYVRKRQHTSAYVSVHQLLIALASVNHGDIVKLTYGPLAQYGSFEIV